jgi:cytochrome c-type biogenesis protein CcmH
MRNIGLVVAVALLAIAPGAAAQEQRASLPDIEDEVMCPICGTTLELSESPQAERERELIRRLIAEGRDKEEIKDALVAEYGEDVLATPESSGFDLAAWILPLAGIGLAAGSLAIWLRRRGGTEATRPDPLSNADADRLQADIDRHDL